MLINGKVIAKLVVFFDLSHIVEMRWIEITMPCFNAVVDSGQKQTTKPEKIQFWYNGASD